VIRAADDLRAGTTLRADVCIVGAGAAGITLARALSGSGLDVVVLESGGHEPDTEVQDLYAGQVTGTPFGDFPDDEALDAVRLRYLGGTTNHWAGFCRPLDPIDFEARPGQHPSGWPLRRTDLDDYYAAALEVLGLASPEFVWSGWADDLAVVDPFPGTSLVRTGAFQVRPVRFGAEFREDLATADDLDVVLGANLIDLTVDQDRVIAATATPLNGPAFTVEADEFVLALGGIENARMLLASGDRPGGIGNENDLVGRYFCEHPQAIIGVATADADPDVLRSVFETGVPVPGEGPDPRPVVRGVMVPTAEAARERNLRSFGIQALAGAVDDDAPVAVNGLSTADVAVYGSTSQGIDARGVLYLLVTGEQALHDDSRVTLADERDALGIPRASVDWRLTVADRQAMLDGVRLFGEELGRLGLGRVQLAPGNLRRADGGGFEVDPEAARPETFQPGIGFHHLCTTRMAADPSEGVVDGDLRVHSLDNLSVAGSSSFATAGSAPPTLTIVAFALRLAETLKARLS
jgi:choline dehydrogenase-like flavoprotein